MVLVWRHAGPVTGVYRVVTDGRVRTDCDTLLHSMVLREVGLYLSSDGVGA